MKITLTIGEAEGRLAWLCKLAHAGHEIFIEDAQKNLVQLGAMPALVDKPRVFGLHRGAWSIGEDFNEPLPDSFWFGEEKNE